MQQLVQAPTGAELKHSTIIGLEKEQKITAGQLAMQLGMEFPQMGLPVVMNDGQPVAVHARDLVNSSPFFLTDHAGQMITVQAMMGG